MNQTKSFGKRTARIAGGAPRSGNNTTKIAVGIAALCVATFAVVKLTTSKSNSAAVAISSSDGMMWVTTDRAELRTCPANSCGVTNKLHYRNGTKVVEVQNGWGRTGNYVDVDCQNGRSKHVDEGNDACTTANGIVSGKAAQWIDMSKLAAIRPPDPAEAATGTAKIVGASTDYHIHRDAFIKAAENLMQSGVCKKADFVEMGGFTSSPNKPNVYFIYCGEMTASNKIYLEATSGRIFR